MVHSIAITKQQLQVISSHISMGLWLFHAKIKVKSR